MNKFTVIGFYSDTRLRYCGHVEANDAGAAIETVAALYPDEEIEIAGVIEGHHNDLMEGDYLESTEDIRNCEATEP